MKKTDLGRPKMEKLLTYKEASEILNIAVGTLRHWVNAEKAPHIKFGEGKGGLVRFKQSTLERWIKGHEKVEVRFV